MGLNLEGGGGSGPPFQHRVVSGDRLQTILSHDPLHSLYSWPFGAVGTSVSCPSQSSGVHTPPLNVPQCHGKSDWPCLLSSLCLSTEKLGQIYPSRYQTPVEVLLLVRTQGGRCRSRSMLRCTSWTYPSNIDFSSTTTDIQFWVTVSTTTLISILYNM